MTRHRRSNPLGLPPRVYHRGNTFFYVRPSDGKWLPLGRTWDLAARTEWARLAGELSPEGTVGELLDEYAKQVVPGKAKRTQEDNREEMKRLRAVFGHMAVADLQRKHAKQYLDARGAKVRGNREIALLSHAIRWGMNAGLCDLEQHPFGSRKTGDGIMFNKERPRRRLVRDDELDRFLSFASSAFPAVAVTMRLMYLTAQRRVDLLALRLSALRIDGLEVVQSKTGARLLLEWTPALRDAVNAACALRPVTTLYLIATRDADRYTDGGMKGMFGKAMAAALSCEAGPPVLGERFRMQDMRPKAVSDVGGGKRGKDLAGHATQATTDRVYDRVTFRRVKPTR